ncbi:MAG: phage integrase N-terminal SAM-like domain-containing protein [Planctomycetia bacterium]|jgi:hypothetical protein|nr:phage integrase N-terminal SAM-like domain-containing protein [Planctomycetia bacterium]
MTSQEDLMDGEEKIEQFLTHLAVKSCVAPSTQNQAMNALVFLYKKVLKGNYSACLSKSTIYGKNPLIYASCLYIAIQLLDNICDFGLFCHIW